MALSLENWNFRNLLDFLFHVSPSIYSARSPSQPLSVSLSVCMVRWTQTYLLCPPLLIRVSAGLFDIRLSYVFGTVSSAKLCSDLIITFLIFIYFHISHYSIILSINLSFIHILIFFNFLEIVLSKMELKYCNYFKNEFFPFSDIS